MKLERNNEVKAPEIIGGFFPRGYFSVVYGKAGVGKSWFVLRTSADCSVGGTIWDFMAFNEPKRSVVIFAAENGINLYIHRLNLSTINIDASNCNIFSANLLSANCQLRLDTDDGIKNIRKIFETHKPDLVFFDTLQGFHTKDENSQKDMAEVYSLVATLAKFYNTAIVLIHHSRKSSSESNQSMDDAIGSSIMQRTAATMYAIEKQKDDIITLRCTKSWLEKPQILGYSIEQQEDGEHINISTSNFCKQYVGSPKQLALKFIRFATEPFTVDDIVNFSSCHPRTVQRILDTLTTQRQIEKLENRRGKWVLYNSLTNNQRVQMEIK